MAARMPIRVLARQARSQYTRRLFSSTSYTQDAQNFTMPAMSPTMTEGNISSWKVKEGDSFSSGDVLLEIETDKASMDVEAQEDGIMAKIFVGDGSKGVQVGTRIAVIAEEGDDLESLQIPEDDSKPVESPAENVKKAVEEQGTSSPAPKGTPENKRPDRERPKTSPKGPGQNPKYPFYPAVQSLILANKIPESDVLKIPATGPNGRLLKGDVLAYLGTIESDYSKAQSDRIKKLGHLDLSNIKIATPKAPADTPAAATATSTGAAAEQERPKLTSVSISVSLAEVLKVQRRIQETLGVTMPLSTFLSRAVDQANDDLPLPKGAKPTSDALFNAVLGLDKVPTTSRGTYLPQITAFPAFTTAAPSSPRSTGTRPLKNPVDIIDILSGRAKPARSVEGRTALAGATSNISISSTSTGGAINLFTLDVPVGEEKRARTFLERVKTVLQVEPGRLVL